MQGTPAEEWDHSGESYCTVHEFLLHEVTDSKTVIVTFTPVDVTVMCDHSNERYWTHFHMIHYADCLSLSVEWTLKVSPILNVEQLNAAR